MANACQNIGFVMGTLTVLMGLTRRTACKFATSTNAHATTGFVSPKPSFATGSRIAQAERTKKTAKVSREIRRMPPIAYRL